jgi:hypothetical protein
MYVHDKPTFAQVTRRLQQQLDKMVETLAMHEVYHNCMFSPPRVPCATRDNGFKFLTLLQEQILEIRIQFMVDEKRLNRDEPEDKTKRNPYEHTFSLDYLAIHREAERMAMTYPEILDYINPPTQGELRKKQVMKARRKAYGATE